MQASGIPNRFPVPWAAGAGPSYKRTIPQTSQIAIQAGAASLTDGFPPLNFQPVGAGGVPPFGQDMNGILNWITQAIQWEQAGGPYNYNSTFATAIGGYPAGAILSATTLGEFWLCVVDNNTSNPDTGGAGWVKFSVINPSEGITAGEGIIVEAHSAIFTGSISGTTLTVSAVTSGAIVVGMSLSDSLGEIAPGTTISGLGTGTGGVGTYVVSSSQSIGSRSMTAAAKQIGLSFDTLPNDGDLQDDDIFARWRAAEDDHAGITAAQLLAWIIIHLPVPTPTGTQVGATMTVAAYGIANNITSGPIIGSQLTAAEIKAGKTLTACAVITRPLLPPTSAPTWSGAQAFGGSDSRYASLAGTWQVIAYSATGDSAFDPIGPQVYNLLLTLQRVS